MFDDETGTFHRATEHNYIIGEVISIADIIKIFEYENKRKNKFKSNKDLKNSAYNLGGLSSDYINDLFTDITQEDYIISYMIVIELYEMYKDDKDKALDTLKRLIMLECESPERYYEQIKRLQLYPNHHTYEYQKSIEDDILKLMRTKLETTSLKR